MDVSFGGVSLEQKALFAKHLAVMLKSGLSIIEALNTVEESASGKFTKVLGKVRNSVESGHSLADSFEIYPRAFPEFLVSVVRAGEASGTLVENLENVAEQLNKEKELVAKLKGAMVYPMVVLIAAFILGMGVSFFVTSGCKPKDVAASLSNISCFCLSNLSNLFSIAVFLPTSILPPI